MAKSKKFGLTDRLKDFLKDEDMFASEVKLMVSRKDQGDMNNLRQRSTLGTVYGGFLTLILYAGMAFYLYTATTKMMSGAKDNIQKQVHTNVFEAPNNQAFMSEFTFLPSIEIKLIKRTKETVEKLVKQGLIEYHSADY